MTDEEKIAPYLTVMEYIGEAPSQMTTIDMLVNSMGDIDEITKVKLLRSVQIREMSASTYIGLGLAIPHARMEEINSMSIAVGYFSQGVDWPDKDNKAKLVVLLAVPHSYVQAYLLFMKKFVRWYESMDEASREARWSQPGVLEADLESLLDV